MIFGDSVGDYEYYVEKNSRVAATTESSRAKWDKPKVTDEPKKQSTERARKLSFKESRELDGMEAVIQAAEENVARIEALFLEPDFHRKHGQRTSELTAELAAEKQRAVKLYERWQELEAVRSGS